MKNYKIKTSHDDWVAPEETLLDSGSDYSDFERPITDGIFKFGFIVYSALLIVIAGFTFKIAIADHLHFADLALNNRSINFSVPPPRGIIFDRRGKPLVKNTPSFDLLVSGRELSGGKNSDNTAKVAEILVKSPDEFQNNLNEELKNNSVFFVAENLSKDQVLKLKYLNPKGFYLVPDSKRSYIDGSQFSQVIGYVGKVNKDDLSDPYYVSTDDVGRLGIEGEYEKLLRGEHGRIFFNLGQDNGVNKDPRAGQNIVLNIDADAQKQLFNELSSVLKEAGVSRAAAIVQNPQNGAVLALVSFPYFDNNLFSSGLTQNSYKSLFENRTRPLFNRVLGGLYNPGSTIKPLIGSMALEEKVVSPDTTIQDCISISIPNPYDKNIVYTYHNWREDRGLFNMRRAIAQSCDVYFYTVGGGYGQIRGLGVERLDKYFKASLVDKILGIDLPGETHGFIPTPDWKLNTRNEPWYQGDTYNISIGQGDLLVTPLWLNSYISAIANGGAVYKPEVANRVVDDNKNPLNIFAPQVVNKLPFSSTVLKEIKTDMRETVLTGTAHLLSDLPVPAAAKTGTAEVVKGRSINSLFTAFAPFDNPEVSITVLVEGSATNQGLAIRAANGFMKWYFTQNNLSTTP